MAKKIDVRPFIAGLLLASVTMIAAPTVAKSTKPATTNAAVSLRATIDAHYGRYRYTDIRTMPARYREFQYTSALKALFARAGGGLDYDVFCGCQEYEEAKFRYHILSSQVNGQRATVRMNVFPFQNNDGRHITLKFLRNAKGAWEIDDVTDREMQSLQARLRATKPGALRVD